MMDHAPNLTMFAKPKKADSGRAGLFKTGDQRFADFGAVTRRSVAGSTGLP
jgi:hypothetical protein